MEEPFSSQTLAGLSGSNPRGINASLIDLIRGKFVSFHRNEKKIVVFIIFKSNLFVYLKHVGLISNENSTIKRFHLDYLDENQLVMRTFHIDYSTNESFVSPMKGIRAIRLTFDEQPVENIRLTVRGCFGIRPVLSTTTSVSVTTSPTPCHSVDLMSNESIVKKVVAFVAGTTPSNGSIFDFFNTSKTISFETNRSNFLVVFKRNIFAQLKSISIIGNETNVRRYQIDLINNDQTILKSLIIDRQNSNEKFDELPSPIFAFEIKVLETIDDRPVKNVRLIVEGCFAIDRSAQVTPPNVVESTTRKATTLPPTRCNEIEMMNRIDSKILLDSIGGTLPTTKLNDYFDETTTISYKKSKMPIKFLLIFKRTIAAEIHSVSLLNSSSNVKRFQVDLIDDYKSIIQTTFSNENFIAKDFSEIAVAAIRIIFLETIDDEAPKAIRLSIRGCFGHLPFPRRTTTTVRPTTKSKTTPKPPIKRKCSILNAMNDENRAKIIESTNSNRTFDLSFNSSFAVFDVAFKENLIGQIENVTLFGDENNVKSFQIVFFGLDHRVLTDFRFERNETMKNPVEHVNSIRFVFFDTIDGKNLRGIRLAIFGCFFRLPSIKRPKPKDVQATKPTELCRQIDLFNRTFSSQIFRRFQIENSTSSFILEFRREIFLRNLRKLSIRSKNSQIQRVRIDLENQRRQLLKRVDVSFLDENDSTFLYSPIYPIHVRFLKIIVLKGEFNEKTQWSLIGCFDRIKKVRKIVKTLQFALSTGKI